MLSEAMRWKCAWCDRTTCGRLLALNRPRRLNGHADMAINVDVPALGESVREAVLIKWHKNDGDAVAAAEPIAELETDKANVDVPAPSAGVFKRTVTEGDTFAVGSTIGQIFTSGEAGAPTNGSGSKGAT